MNGFNSKRFNSDAQMQYPNEQLFARGQGLFRMIEPVDYGVIDRTVNHLDK